MNKKTKTKEIIQTDKTVLTVENIIDAVSKNHGNIVNAARNLNCDRASIYKMISKHPELKALINKIREEIVDEAEISLLERIREGNITSIIFALKTLGKSRGYTSSENKSAQNIEYLSEADLKKLSNEQLNYLEKLIKSGKDPRPFLISAGVNVTVD